MYIIMESKELDVLAIKKKTQAKMFKDIVPGDTLKLSTPVKYLGTSNSGSYAATITVENLTTGAKAYKTFNELPRLLKCFHLEAKL